MSFTGLRFILVFFLLLICPGQTPAAKRAGTGGEDVSHLHVVFFGTRSTPLEGFEFSLLGSVPTGAFRGFQVAGVFNYNKGSGTGLQLSGFLNHTRGTFLGMQAGPVNSNGRLHGLGLGLVNETSHLLGLHAGAFNVAVNARGAQLGFFNHAGNLAGLQVGPINLTFRFYGVQVGIVNVQASPEASPQGLPSARNGAGLQVGLFNYAVDAGVGQIGYFNMAQSRRSTLPMPGRNPARTINTSWLQAGFINLSDNDSCVQIGIVNVTNRVRCASIGLFNFIREGMFSATLWREPMGGTNFGFRFTGKHLYYLLGAGNANPVYGCEGQNSFHLHVGAMMPLRKRWTLEADFGWSFFNAFHDQTTRRAPARKGIPDLERLSLRLMVRFRMFDFFSIYAGVGPGWLWDEDGVHRGGFVPVILGGVSADLPGHVW